LHIPSSGVAVYIEKGGEEIQICSFSHDFIVQD